MTALELINQAKEVGLVEYDSSNEQLNYEVFSMFKPIKLTRFTIFRHEEGLFILGLGSIRYIGDIYFVANQIQGS